MALVLSALATSVHADVAPGDKIDGTNVAKAKDLISPGLEWCINRGFPITVGETKRVEWPKAYKEATEKYAPQVKLSADGLTVSNYVAGQPFPNLDPKDPQFPLKIMWNYEYGFANGLDDTDLRNFDATRHIHTGHPLFSRSSPPPQRRPPPPPPSVPPCHGVRPRAPCGDRSPQPCDPITIRSAGSRCARDSTTSPTGPALITPSAGTLAGSAASASAIRRSASASPRFSVRCVASQSQGLARPGAMAIRL